MRQTDWEVAGNDTSMFIFWPTFDPFWVPEGVVVFGGPEPAILPLHYPHWPVQVRWPGPRRLVPAMGSCKATRPAMAVGLVSRNPPLPRKIRRTPNRAQPASKDRFFQSIREASCCIFSASLVGQREERRKGNLDHISERWSQERFYWPMHTTWSAPPAVKNTDLVHDAYLGAFIGDQWLA